MSSLLMILGWYLVIGFFIGIVELYLLCYTKEFDDDDIMISFRERADKNVLLYIIFIFLSSITWGFGVIEFFRRKFIDK